jgi:histidine triad (HIT) family protein
MECIFCEFINGRETHVEYSEFTKGKQPYPIIPIFENNTVFSFLSAPDNKGETHLLVIPKEHEEFIENLNKKHTNEIFLIVAKMAGIIRENYGDCSISLNNGRNADQYIKHIHFHIIPKTSEKKVLWDNPSIEEFKKISNDLRQLFKTIN